MIYAFNDSISNDQRRYRSVHRAGQLRSSDACTAYGDSWNTLRVAISIAVEDTGANIPGVVFRMGLCHGTTNMPGDVTTDNSYGLEFITGFQRNAGPPVNFVSLLRRSPFRRVGSTLTTGATSWFTGLIGVVNACRQVIFVDIIKGSPNYTFKVFYKIILLRPATFHRRPFWRKFPWRARAVPITFMRALQEPVSP